MENVIVTGSFDNMNSHQMRFLEKAAGLGKVHALLWSDETVRLQEGNPPKFPLEERLFFLQAVRYVGSIGVVNEPFERGLLPTLENPPESGAVRAWVVDEMDDNEDRRSFCLSQGLEYFLITKADTLGFPAREYQPQADQSGNKKVLVTGCYDWVHSGHVRFFEEVSGLGDLFVVVGNDANVNFLKGAGHPMFSQDERRYLVQSIRYVKQALITSGSGWMDAEPEIDLVKPDYYAVNEDGDKPEKRLFCQEHGITYVVLKRTPKEGLPRRNSTDLRGY